MNNHNPNKDSASRSAYTKPDLTVPIYDNSTNPNKDRASRSAYTKPDLTPTIYEDPRPCARDRNKESNQSPAYTVPTHTQLQTLDSDTLVELLTTIHAILNERDEV